MRRLLQIGQDRTTNRRRVRQQARAIPARRGRALRARRWRATPFVALGLCLLALLAPQLTLAPLEGAAAPSPTARHLDEGIPDPPGDAQLLGPTTADTRPPWTPPSRRTHDLVAALDAARAASGADGLTFAAVRDGRLTWAGASGVARDGWTPLTASTPLVIGSVTKTFVAAAILQLVDEGRLDLADSVRDHLPELAPISREITIRQLLDHTSGLADLFNDATRIGIEEAPAVPWSTDEILASLHAPWYAPGEGWAYANTNYYLLSMIVERVTGARLADELERRFLDPLRLDATATLDGAIAGAPLSSAWTTIFWGSGAMSSSSVDLARWGHALYEGGVVSAGLRREMLAMNHHDYGLGVQEIEIRGRTGIGHTGLLDTYTTLLFHLPDEDLTIVFIANSNEVELRKTLTAEPRGGGPSLWELALEG